jgi:glycerol-3-phosphate acyltransferase PlsY
MLAALLVVFAYLLGSVPTGVLLARARGIDIRHVGSGNIGATNVARSLGKTLGLVTLVLDCAKGALPTLLAREIGLSAEVVAGVGLAAFLGHVFSAFLKLRGGKGVATALGVFLVVAPAAAAISVGLYVGCYLLFRISSVGSLVGAIALPVSMAALGTERPYLWLAGGILAVIVFTHRGNLQRLLTRREHRV